MWGITKKSLKIAITATMARSDREVYIQLPPPPPPTKGTWKESDILVLFHYIAFIIWELPSINFGIKGVVAGTTPVTILRIIRLHLDVVTMTDEFTLHQTPWRKINKKKIEEKSQNDKFLIIRQKYWISFPFFFFLLCSFAVACFFFVS